MKVITEAVLEPLEGAQRAGRPCPRLIIVKGTYTWNGKVYVSPDYDTADHRVDLDIRGGSGNITIRDAGDE